MSSSSLIPLTPPEGSGADAIERLVSVLDRGNGLEHAFDCAWDAKRVRLLSIMKSPPLVGSESFEDWARTDQALDTFLHFAARTLSGSEEPF